MGGTLRRVTVGALLALSVLVATAALGAGEQPLLRLDLTLSASTSPPSLASAAVSASTITTLKGSRVTSADAVLSIDRPPVAALRAKAIAIAPPATSALARREPLSPNNVFHVLAYHDVFPSLTSKQDVGDAGAITVDEMTRHFSWLRDNGYRVVSLQRVLDARSGGEPLPAKSVMLSFDDGYKSFHTHVLPVLKLFGYPATLAIISQWIDNPSAATIEYEATRTVASQFMSWDEIRDCLDSGLVEVASHTHDLHHGHLGNPQGNKQPAAITRRYDPTTASYESEAMYEARIRADLTMNSDTLAARLGVRPRAVVWPYGAYNALTQRIAAELGMPIGLTVGDGLNSDETSLAAIGRDLIDHDTDTYDIAASLRSRDTRTQRVVTVDLPAEMIGYSNFDETSLSSMLERMLILKPSIVILRAHEKFSAAKSPSAVFFWNSVVPVRANLLNRVAWQLRTRGGVRVFVEDPAESMNARDRLTLLTELGRYNHFAGFVRGLDAPSAPATDPGVAALVQNHPALETMQRVALDARCGDELPSPNDAAARTTRNASYSRWREAAALNRWVLLRVRAVRSESCTLKWWKSLAAIGATMPDWQQRTIVEIDNDIARDHGEESVVKPLLNAYAAGFRHLGYAHDDMRADRPTATVVKQAISLETHPVKQR